MKITTLLTFATLTTLTASCSKDEAAKTDGGRVVSFNDFESTAGWGVDPTLLSREKAHSGQYSISVDGNREFSLTYENSLGNLSAQKFTKVRLSAWVYLMSPKGNGSLGVQFTDPAQGNKAIGGEGIALAEEVKKYNEWVEVSKEFTLPAGVTSANHLKVFLWRGMASQAIFVDDVRITIPE